jgi:hypothetical protein
MSVSVAGAANSKRKRKRRHIGVRGLTAEMEIEWQCGIDIENILGDRTAHSGLND